MAETETAPLSLAAEFAPATRDAWMKLVEGALKGAPAERLRSKTYDALAIEPLYAGDRQTQAVAGRAPVAAWQVLQRVDHPDPKAANAEALQDLENGATGLTLVSSDAPGANGFGLSPNAADLARALNNVHLDAGVALECDAGADAQRMAGHLAALTRAGGLAPASVDIRFGFDPLGAYAAGSSALDWSAQAPKFAASIAGLAASGFKGPFAAADARVIHAAGGSEAQELAFALASAVSYLRALEAGGIPLDDARKMIFFRLAVDADQFLGIAKLRALRKLWARIEEACGLTPKPAFVTAETAWRMMTQRDPWVNMLRATIATFAAGVGGADAIGVLPFTAALGLPDRFARRIARNTQLILLDESNLSKVTDPAAGAGGIEDLTTKLCHAAWTLFQDIETAGGAFAALGSGLIQRKVAETRAAHEHAVARRKDALTGATEFPDIHELPVSVLAPIVTSPRLRGEVGAHSAPGEGAFRHDEAAGRAPHPNPLPASGEREFEPLPRIRLAAPFERLRDASDAALAKTGARPKIFLANLGRPADFVPRATYAKNFFETGGIEAVTNEGFAAASAAEGEKRTDLAALAAAYKESGAKLACLCSSDAVYESDAVAAAQALSAAGATHIYLAGRPRDLEQALRKAGISTFIYVGCDALATLTAAHDILRDRS